MAHIIKFRCEACGYETDVYEGRGFMGQHIEMITCPDCKTIQPLVVGGVIADTAPPFTPSCPAISITPAMSDADCGISFDRLIQACLSVS